MNHDGLLVYQLRIIWLLIPYSISRWYNQQLCSYVQNYAIIDTQLSDELLKRTEKTIKHENNSSAETLLTFFTIVTKDQQEIPAQLLESIFTVVKNSEFFCDQHIACQ